MANQHVKLSEWVWQQELIDVFKSGSHLNAAVPDF